MGDKNPSRKKNRPREFCLRFGGWLLLSIPISRFHRHELHLLFLLFKPNVCSNVNIWDTFFYEGEISYA